MNGITRFPISIKSGTDAIVLTSSNSSARRYRRMSITRHGVFLFRAPDAPATKLPSSPELFEQVMSLLHSARLDMTRMVESNHPMNGGTTVSLQLYELNESYYDAHVYGNQHQIDSFNTTANLFLLDRQIDELMGRMCRERRRFSFAGNAFTMLVFREEQFSFALAEREVSQGLWIGVMGNNPSSHKHASWPVDNVSWDDCQQFISRLNNAMNQRFRLPTEFEWEWGHGCHLTSSNDRMADVEENPGYPEDDDVHFPDETFTTPYGLTDVMFNSGEWCADDASMDECPDHVHPTLLQRLSGSCHVTRFADFNDSTHRPDTSRRTVYPSSFRMPTMGFRLAMDYTQITTN